MGSCMASQDRGHPVGGKWLLWSSWGWISAWAPAPQGDAPGGRQPQLRPWPPPEPRCGDVSRGAGWGLQVLPSPAVIQHPSAFREVRGRDEAPASPVSAVPVIPLTNGSELGMPPSHSRSPARGGRRSLLQTGSVLHFASLMREM